MTEDRVAEIHSMNFDELFASGVISKIALRNFIMKQEFRKAVRERKGEKLIDDWEENGISIFGETYRIGRDAINKILYRKK